MVVCPFCHAPESDRFTLEGTRFLVFRCMFTAETEPGLADDAIPGFLAEKYGRQGTEFFRRTCDALHRVVVRPATPGDAASS